MTAARSLVAPFREALAPDRPEHGIDDQTLGELLEAAWQSGCRAWPAVELPRERFARHLARVLSHPDNAGRALAELHIDDLYLAGACARGDAAAIRACEAHAAGEIDRALARQGVDPATAEDLKQGLREWLFVAPPGQEPQILTYRGQGRLAGWLKVIAVRRALRTFRTRHRTRSLEQELEPGSHPLLGGGDPEQQLSKLVLRSELRDAFREAVRALDPGERRLLARNIIEGASIDVLGQELGVHRATAARRLEKARRNLFYAIRRTIMQPCSAIGWTAQATTA